MDNSQEDITTILFVDDQPSCHKVLELALMHEQKYDLLSAFTVKEAKDLITKHHKKLVVVVSDIMMPDDTGYKLFEFLISNEAYKNIPFILQSGFVDNSAVLTYDDGRPVPVISKPYSHRDLLKLIEQVQN